MRGGKLRWSGALLAAFLIVIGLATPAIAQPSVTGFSPTHGFVGDSVVITGTGFTNASDVLFGGTSAAPNFNVDDDTQITATVPAGASTGPISVTTPDGTRASAVNFTVDVHPVIESLTPDHGPEHATVVISGSGFTGVTDVSFAGTSADFIVDNDTKITATVPTGALNGQVTVSTPVDSATSTDSFFVEPNIVMILTDDQRWDTLWSMPTVESELVDKGITFSNGFVVNSVCCPSRVSFLTGEYSHTSGVYSNKGPYGGFSSFHGDSSTIATWLHDRGYRTALLGKYLNGYSGTYVPPGWDRWFATYANEGYYNYSATDDGVVTTYGDTPADYGTTVLAAQAQDFIDNVSTQQPLLLYFAPHAPHGPATPAPQYATAFSDLAPWRPPSYNEKNIADKPQYVRQTPSLRPTDSAAIDAFRLDQYRTLLSVDDAVSGILQSLADTDRLDNTLILFASDNGFQWGEHRLTGKNVPYEESIRIPYVIRWDRLSNVPRTDTSLVANIDVAPTFAALAGTTAPRADGVSLVPLFKQSGTSWRPLFLIEHLGGGIHEAPSFCAVRNQTQIFVHYASGEEEFYTLPTDPYELKNKSANARSQATIARLRDKARALCNPLPPGMPPF